MSDLGLILQATSAVPDATATIVQTGAVGAVAVISLAATVVAWRRIQTITDRFLAHLEQSGRDSADAAARQVAADLAVAGALDKITSRMDANEDLASARHAEAMHEIRRIGGHR